jgi:transcriptional regulator
MYIPNAYRQDDLETLVAFMRAHSFATLVSVVDGAPFASHIPFVIRAEVDNQVVLTGHVAKANPHWRFLEQGDSLVIFSGPHAYVSPSLYEKRESVPTWNYIAVHAYGVARLHPTDQDPTLVRQMLEEMVQTYDPNYLVQWNDLTAKFREGLMQGIVAFELPVARLEGKAKLSQNRSLADQQTVAQALANSDDPAAAAVGAAMHHNLARQAEEAA